MTGSAYENIFHQLSSVDQFFSALGTVEATTFEIRKRFPLNNPTNYIQKDRDLLPAVFCFVFGEVSRVEVRVHHNWWFLPKSTLMNI